MITGLLFSLIFQTNNMTLILYIMLFFLSSLTKKNTLFEKTKITFNISLYCVNKQQWQNITLQKYVC